MASFYTKLTNHPYAINLKKAFHHEEHRDHEGFCELGMKPPIPASPDSWGYMLLAAHPQGDWHFLINRLFFFVPFVFFVVQMPFHG